MNKKSSIFVTFVLPIMATAAVSGVDTVSIQSKIESAVPWLQLAGFSAVVVNNGLQAALTLKQLGKAGKAD